MLWRQTPEAVRAVIDAFGGLTPMAKEGIAPVQTISSWRSAGRIPKWRVEAIELAAERRGLVIADIVAPFMAQRREAGAA